MENEQVRVGMRVTPFQKTVRECNSFDVWLNVQESPAAKYFRENGYVIVGRFDECMDAWVLKDIDNNGGDYFNAEDFEPYEEQIKNNIKVVQRENGKVICNNIKTNDSIHIHEIQPSSSIAYVRDIKGELISTQTIIKEKTSYKVIYKPPLTIVVLDDGSKGVSKCNYLKDGYNHQTGHDIAWYRAKINQLQKLIEKY